MTIIDNLKSLLAQGVIFQVEGNSLRWNAPAGLIDTSMRKYINQHKKYISRYLLKNKLVPEYNHKDLFPDYSRIEAHETN